MLMLMMLQMRISDLDSEQTAVFGKMKGSILCHPCDSR